MALSASKASMVPPVTAAPFPLSPVCEETRSQVKRLHQYAGALLISVLLGYPAMDCLIPGAEMTESERECCKHMAQQCGSMDMPSSDSCCQKDISRPTSMLAAAAVYISPPVAMQAAIIDLRESPSCSSRAFFLSFTPAA